MTSSSLLHCLATQHFDERFKRKQSESLLSTPFGSQVTVLLEPNIYIWVVFFESSI